MKIRNRVAAVFAAFAAAVMSVFVAAPALASGGEEKIDTLEPFRHAGEPADWVAIAIVMVVLAVFVFATAGFLSSLFKKN